MTPGKPFPTPPPEGFYPIDQAMRRGRVLRDARVWALSLTLDELYVMRADRGVVQGQEPETPAASRLLGRLWRRLSDRGLTIQDVADLREQLLAEVARGLTL